MPNKLIPLTRPTVGNEELEAVKKVFESGYITEGLVTKEFENDVAAYVGCNHAIALTSCSAALEIALRVLDVGPGDEIIAPDFTYPITAGVAFLVGAKPVLVDVKLDDYKIDFAEVEKAITPKTKAVLPVSIFGNPVDIKPLRELQEKHGFAIIEDAACPRSTLEDRKNNCGKTAQGKNLRRVVIAVLAVAFNAFQEARL